MLIIINQNGTANFSKEAATTKLAQTKKAL